MTGQEKNAAQSGKLDLKSLFWNLLRSQNSFKKGTSDVITYVPQTALNLSQNPVKSVKSCIWVFLTFLTFCRIIKAKCATLRHVHAKRKTTNFLENLNFALTGSRETSSIPGVIACSKMAATGELAGVKA